MSHGCGLYYSYLNGSVCAIFCSGVVVTGDEGPHLWRRMFGRMRLLIARVRVQHIQLLQLRGERSARFEGEMQGWHWVSSRSECKPEVGFEPPTLDDIRIDLPYLTGRVVNHSTKGDLFWASFVGSSVGFDCLDQSSEHGQILDSFVDLA